MSLDLWTSLQEASPASPGASQASNGARETTATSGRRCAALLKSRSPLGSLWRMLLVSHAWHSTTYALTWTPEATKSGHVYFRLRPSVRRTSASASLSWHDGRTATLVSWPTPDAAQGYSYTAGRTPGGTGQPGVRLYDAMRMLAWPTPMAGDATGSRSSKGKDRPDEGGLAFAAKTWATPRTDGFDAGRHRGKADSLHSQVKASAWPTPTASDKTTRKPSERWEGKSDLSSMVNGAKLNPEWVESLMGFPEGWTEVDALAIPGRSARTKPSPPAKRRARSRAASPTAPAA